MAALTLNVDGATLTTELAKVSRADLYGESRVKVLGPDDQLLVKAAVPEDGSCFVGRGEVQLAQKVDGSFSLAPTEAVDALSGKPKEPVASSFKEAPNFRRAKADEVCWLEAKTIYQIDAPNLKPGDMFLGHFNYRAGLEKNDAAIVTNSTGAFLLVGNLKAPGFVGIEDDSQLILAEEAQGDDDSGEGDFSSLL
jgi:hypothetical protein